MERIRFFNIIFYRVIISRSLETDRKFTKVCSTKGKVKIVLYVYTHVNTKKNKRNNSFLEYDHETYLGKTKHKFKGTEKRITKTCNLFQSDIAGKRFE